MKKQNSKPNIIIFNPDQWRGDVLGHMGNKGAHTPNLDQIVKEDGVSFRNSFCQNTVCTPSRCSFMTGWYPHTRGHRTMYYMLHPEHNETNLLKVLKENGYYVWWGGKNDLVPGQSGYKEHCNKKYHGLFQFASKLKLVKEQQKLYRKDWRGSPENDNYYSFYYGKAETIGDNPFLDFDWAKVQGAIKFIKKYKKKKPFCIYLPLSFPHPQYVVDDPWYSMIDRSKLPERVPTPKNWDKKPSILKGIYEKQNLKNWTEERWTELRATYYGMCARVDDFYGQILNALRESNQYDETSVFFFSDHGDFTGDFGIVEKTQNTFEECLSNIPFVIKPAKKFPFKPRVSDAIVELVDFPATVYEMAGIKPNYTHFGKSLLSLLNSEDDEHRDVAFCEGGRLKGEIQAMEWDSKSSTVKEGLYWPRISLQTSDDGPYHSKAAMIRTKDFKYTMRLYEIDEFYDLRNDPHELVNEIDNPKYNEEITKLRNRMLKWYMETSDVVPMKTDKRGMFFVPFPKIKRFLMKD